MCCKYSLYYTGYSVKLQALFGGNTTSIQLRRFTEILCPDVGLGSLREFHPRCRNFLQYTKYCCETAPNQYAKFTRKSLLLYYAVLPLYLCYSSYSQHKIAVSYRNEVLTMLFPALFALGGAFFFFVLRVQGADGSFPKPLTPDEEAVLLRRMQQTRGCRGTGKADRAQSQTGSAYCEKVLRCKIRSRTICCPSARSG